MVESGIVRHSGSAERRPQAGRRQTRSAEPEPERKPNGNRTATPPRIAGSISYLPLMAATDFHCSSGSVLIHYHLNGRRGR